MAKGRGTSPVVWLLVAVVIVVVAYFAWPKSTDAPDDDTQDVVGTSMTDTVVLANVMPEDWKRYNNAASDIDDLGPDGQDIAFYVLQDPADANTAYFASYAFNDATQEQFLGIYKYDVPTYTFERIYKKSYGEGDVDWMRSGASPVWRIVGYDHGKLVVLMEDADNSPGPCAQPFLVGVDNEDVARLFTLDLEKPTAGLAPYTPDATLLKEARDAEEACTDGM